jgi:hypothetical protein
MDSLAGHRPTATILTRTKPEVTMTIYKLAQQVKVGLNTKEWVDILSDPDEYRVRNYAVKVKDENPEAVLGLRSVTETELHLGI